MSKEADIKRAMDLIVELGNLQKAIKGGPFPTDLLSVLGEFNVFLKLRKLHSHFTISFKRKAKADMSIDSVNIEVKTSNLKKEEYGEGYGYALHVKKCKQHPDAYFEHRRRGRIPGDLCYFEYLICVAIDERDIGSPLFYIFSRNELDAVAPKIENKSERFWYSPYRILIPIRPNPSQRGILYNDFDLTLAKDEGRFRNRWDKIKVNHTP